MKKQEIEERLLKGEKLLLENNSYFEDCYFIGSKSPENRLSKKQFEKARESCTHSDEKSVTIPWLKGQSYTITYWR